MTILAFILLTLGVLLTLAMLRAPLIAWAGGAAVLALIAGTAVPGFGFGTIVLLLPAAVIAALSVAPIRKAVLTGPAFKVVKRILPPVSETEQEALDAGTVGWDAELFSGTPDWKVLDAIPGNELTDEERAFLDGPTEELCQMLDDWQVRHELKDIPDQAWQF
ncbi:MAG: acyl-CoA dehydrogenase, partial [Pseudomonadota bacterium]